MPAYHLKNHSEKLTTAVKIGAYLMGAIVTLPMAKPRYVCQPRWDATLLSEEVGAKEILRRILIVKVRCQSSGSRARRKVYALSSPRKLRDRGDSAFYVKRANQGDVLPDHPLPDDELSATRRGFSTSPATHEGRGRFVAQTQDRHLHALIRFVIMAVAARKGRSGAAKPGLPRAGAGRRPRCRITQDAPAGLR